MDPRVTGWFSCQPPKYVDVVTVCRPQEDAQTCDARHELTVAAVQLAFPPN